MNNKQPELKLIYAVVLLVFGFFLLLPIGVLFQNAFHLKDGFGLAHFEAILNNAGFIQAFKNSLLVSIATAFLATFLAFIVAYAVNMTHLPKWLKKTLHMLAQFPMLLPTITYGFVIIYTFGKQGLLTQVLGHQIFSDIYGFKGLLLGYTLYTLPICFILINNTFKYLDKKFVVVSIVMQDSAWRRCRTTLLRPLLGTFAAAMIQAFFLSFTDYGIPASVGGRFDVVATHLYQEMLGVNPSFERGAVIALFMLAPSIISIALLQYLERYNIRYQKVSQLDLPRSRAQDWFFGVFATLIVTSMVGIFLVMFIAPMTENWPYILRFNTYALKDVLTSSTMMSVYQNSLWVAAATAILGTILSFGAALTTARSRFSKRLKGAMEAMILITNSVPGMVLGIAFLLLFAGTSLHNTLLIIVLCNIVHFFATPYLMAKNALNKMNHNWENTAALMGDSWFKTLWRVILPNAKATLAQMFTYYFINAMVTVSAVIFITGARTMVMTTKIKELQHFAKFDEIFILSIFILLTNLALLAIMKASSKLSSR
ncbi:MAG: ABC transporter permease subunit [Neisseriaceae bacterium]|nr:ABC transporter permease subunit [Neisseriaceae bacterium]